MSPDSSVFATFERAYCVWEPEGVKKKNIEFLRGLDAGYFGYVVERNFEQLDSDEHGLRAAMSIRLAYYQALEMFFSLVGSWLQAPDCAYGWIEKCRTNELRSVVESISSGQGLELHRTSLKEFSWERIGRGVFVYAYSDQAKCRRVGERFGGSWRQLASDFLDENHIAEFNALKHGNRVSPGGFTFSAGIQDSPGKVASPESMQVLTHSRWGSTFNRLEKFGGTDSANRSYRSKQESLNWNAWNTAAAVQLIEMSIKNLISIMLISSGVQPSAVQFFAPVDDEDFDKPWAQGVGLMSHVTFALEMTESSSFHSTQGQLVEMLRKNES